MPGTILLTGANGSLAVPAVQHMLESYPSFTLVLAVRDDSDQDPNTVALRKTISAHPDANVFIRKLDMSSLDEVKSFSETLRSEVEQGKLPRIASIICNAFSWKLSGGPGFSKEGFESTMAISHLAHFAMVLRLLSAMEAQHGRIVFLGSEAHWPERAGLSKGGFPTKLPGNLDTLVHPSADPKDQEMGLGFQRYGWSKLVITMVANELSRRLKENKDTESLRVVTVDPGNLLTSHTWSKDHVPMKVRIMITIACWLLPLLRLFQPRLMSAEHAAKPVVEVAVADGFAGQEGYFENDTKTAHDTQKRVVSSPDSLNEGMQKRLWRESVAWCGLKQEDTVINL